MKVEHSDILLSFKPFTITLTIETQKELDEFYAIHDYTPLVEATPNLSHEKIRSALYSHGDNKNFGNIIQAIEKNIVRLNGYIKAT